MKDLLPISSAIEVVSGAALALAVIVYGLNRALRLTGLPARERKSASWSASAVLVAWFFASLALSWSGFYHGAAFSVPTIPFGLLIPIAAGVTLFWRVRVLRQIVESAPQS